MKKFLKSAISLVLLAVMVFSLASCSLVSPIIGEKGFFGFYSGVDASEMDGVLTTLGEKIAYTPDAIVGSTVDYAYKVTYDYEFANKAEGYDYTVNYNLVAEVNPLAVQGGVFANFVLKTKYTQADGQHGIDTNTEICIIRANQSWLLEDNIVYVRVNGGSVYSATLAQMEQKLEEAEVYFTPVNGAISNPTVFRSDAPEYTAYTELIIKWTECVTGMSIVSSGDNPLVHVTHSYNVGMFEQLITDAKTGSDKQYKVGMSGDNMFRASRSYSMKETNFEETIDIVSFLKINDNTNYSCKYVYEFARKHPYEDKTSKYERVFEPLTEDINKPSFVA